MFGGLREDCKLPQLPVVISYRVKVGQADVRVLDIRW